jgi:hypothetical protein
MRKSSNVLILKCVFLVMILFGSAIPVMAGYSDDVSSLIEGQDTGIWKGTDGIWILAEPDNVALYRHLLPKQFEMPDHPLISIYAVNFYKTGIMTPYYELGVFLKCIDNGEEAWFCLTMPVTTAAAYLGGIAMGFPKYVADAITMTGNSNYLKYTVKYHFRTNASITFSAGGVPGNLPQWQTDFLENGGGAMNAGEKFVNLLPPLWGPTVWRHTSTAAPVHERVQGMATIYLADLFIGLYPFYPVPFTDLIAPGTIVPAIWQQQGDPR